MSSSQAPDPELLLRHASFVRALARRLTCDESSADDLVQDTWLAALERPSASVRSPERWLRGIVANLWREGRRSVERRRTREELAARAEESTSSFDTLDSAIIGRKLAAVVLELDEPFRTAVLLRYYEDLSPREIAERLHVPVKTVSSRLSRGLDRVRTNWKRIHGDDPRAWLGALLAIVRPSRALPDTAPSATAVSALSAGAIVMSTKTLLTSAALLSCAALAILWARSPDADSRARQSARSVEAHQDRGDSLSAPALVAGTEAGASLRAPAAGAFHAENRTSGQDSLLPRMSIRGRVMSSRAQPLAGVEVVYRSESAPEGEVRAKSGVDGVFVLDAPRGTGTVVANDAALVTIVYGLVRASTTLEPLVIVAPFRDLAGRVVDELGSGLASARVHFVLPPAFASRFDAVFDATEAHEWRAQADGDGRFEIFRAPIVDDARLAADLDGYVGSGVDAPLATDRNVEIVLVRPSKAETALRGRVEDAAGLPVARARVTLGAQSTTADPRGEFQLSTADAESSTELVALQRGFLPGRVSAQRDLVSGKIAWPDLIVVRLGGPPLALEGCVVDKSGEPMADVRVWVADPTPFGILGAETNAKIEFLLASKQPQGSDEELSDANWSGADTDEHGRFRVEGLLARAYSLRVLDKKSCGAITAGPFVAGARDVTVVFDQGELRRIAGRIVTRAGRPVDNVRVELMGETYGGNWNYGGTRTTSVDGRFAFDGVGRNRISLWIRGDDVVSLIHVIDDAKPATDLELAVLVRCHFKVECRSIDFADSLATLDAGGNRLSVSEVGANGETTSESFEILDGRSKTLAVASDARTLVLSKGGKEVLRIPLDLVPGQLNLIQP
jgi:RNA polymerase sigma-70 factor (ECF subfamily)